MLTPIVYADTSVFGGVFDDEFQEASEGFFKLVTLGRFRLLLSDLVRQELLLAPEPVRRYFEEYFPYIERMVPFDEEVLRLRDAYLEMRVIGARWADDAGHVAAATVGGADVIVSWNFRHLVNLDRIRRYNAVNVLRGYPAVEIRSPAEVIDYEG